MVLSQSERSAWRETGANAVRVAKIKARELQQSAKGVQSAVQANPKVAGVVKAAGTVGKVAKFAVPGLSGVLDAGMGLAEGEDPTRAIAGAAGSTAGGLGGAWAGAGAGAAVGAVGAPFTFGLSVPVGAAIGGVAGAVGGSMLGGWGADRVDQAVRGKQPIDTQREQQPGATPTGSSTPSYQPINGAFKVDPKATYRYQPMKPDGSGGVVTQSSGMPAPVTQRQQRGGVQPASFTQGGNGKPNTVNVGGTDYLQGFEPGGSRSTFTESAAAGAPQTPSPSNNGQLVQAGLNPLPAIAKGLGRAAPVAAAVPAAAAKGSGVNPLAEFAKEGFKQVFSLPLLAAGGLLYGAPRVAGAAVAGINAPGSMNPNALPSQPSFIDRTFFGGKLNEMFGNPGGLNYQNNQMRNATTQRGQNIRQGVDDRRTDAKVYDTDVDNETKRQGNQLRIQGIDMTLQSNERRTNVQYGPGGSTDRTNATNLQRTGMQHGEGGSVDRTNATNLQRTNVQYGPGGSTDRGFASKERQVTQTNQTRFGIANLQHGKGGSSDRKNESQERREVTKGDYKIADSTVKGEYKILDTQESNKGKVQVAAIGYAGKVDSATVTGNSRIAQEGVRQSGQSNVATIRAGGQVGAAEANAAGRVAAAGVNLTGTQYKADATVKVASINSSAKSGQAEVENSKINAATNATVIKSANAMMQSDEKNRLARLKQLGVY